MNEIYNASLHNIDKTNCYSNPYLLSLSLSPLSLSLSHKLFIEASLDSVHTGKTHLYY